MRFDSLAVEEDVRREQLAAEQIVDDKRRDVALAAARIIRRPVVLLVGGVQAPGVADRLLKLREREGQR
jgi:hypothetical protein